MDVFSQKLQKKTFFHFILNVWIISVLKSIDFKNILYVNTTRTDLD